MDSDLSQRANWSFELNYRSNAAREIHISSSNLFLDEFFKFIVIDLKTIKVITAIKSETSARQ